MGSETPNQELLDTWLGDMNDRYLNENLTSLSERHLEQLEADVKVAFLKFRSSFPPEESVVQGPVRAAVYDDPSEDKQPLTTADQHRLDQAQLDIELALRKAKSDAEHQQREHRMDLMNSMVAIVYGLAQSCIALWAAVKEATPW